MSYESSLRQWQSSDVGLSHSCHGLSLLENQQIRQIEQMKQKSRRVSLNANFAKSTTSGKSEDSPHQTQDRHHSVETLCNSDAVQSIVVKNCNSGLSLNRVNFNQSVVNNCMNSGINSGISSALSSAVTTTASSTTASTMLPIISYENVVNARPNVDLNRVNRRMSKAVPESFTCSQQSILSAMDRFVKSVNNMDSTVLVPSKLRDMEIASAKLQRIPPALANTDLHSFYLMLNDVRKELLWGPYVATGSVGSVAAANLIPLSSGRSSPRELKHIRQPSDDSLGSLGSTASSSSDQDTDSEADSMMTDRDSIDEHTSHLAAAFRHHLQGLHTILHQLADSADYLSSRYQEEIDVSSL